MKSIKDSDGFRNREFSKHNYCGIRQRRALKKSAQNTIPHRYVSKQTDAFKFKVLEKINGYEVVMKSYRNKCAYDLYDLFKTQKMVLFPSHELQIRLAEEEKIKGKILFPFLVFNKFLADTKKLIGIYMKETTGAGNNMIFHDLSMPISSFSVVTLKKAG